jgi:CTP:phosphocholine cytidylyltransferase-like protein
MLNFGVIFLGYNRKKIDDKVAYTLFFKEQFKYLKTAHSYHLVDPSPWPLMASLGGFMLTSGLVMYMNKFIGG